MKRIAPWIVVATLGCRGPSEALPAASASASPAPPPTGSVRAPKQQPLADESVEIPAGAFRAGSEPGEPGRRPELEPRLADVELGAFQIDRLPYPNDPTQPPKTGVERDQAKRLCAERGARLCTELEWERACKGPNSDRFPTGPEWAPRCAEEPRTCATGFDVLAMGAALREWTASDVIPSSSKDARLASVRGAAASAPAAEHRCAARRGLAAETSAEDLGFRCCRGAPNAAAIKEPRAGATFKKLKLTAERVEKLLSENERTRSIARDVKFFRDPDAANTVIARGPGDKKGFSFTVAPLLWNPVAGAEFLILVGRSGDSTSFVAAYHVIADDRYKLAASFVMKNEPGPVALAYDEYIRPRLHFSTCWGCPGETGKILYRDPDTVSILQP